MGSANSRGGSKDRDGGAFMFVQRAKLQRAAKELHGKEKSQWRQAAVLSARGRTMARECGARSAQ